MERRSLPELRDDRNERVTLSSALRAKLPAAHFVPRCAVAEGDSGPPSAFLRLSEPVQLEPIGAKGMKSVGDEEIARPAMVGWSGLSFHNVLVIDSR